MATRVDQKHFVKTALRLPPEMHAAVHASAQKSGRSYNAELVFLIERALTLPAAFIPAPESLGTIDEHGVLVHRSPRELMTALAGDRPMFAPLPASRRTIMDGLVDDCFF